jgi:hypothetical protein
MEMKSENVKWVPESKFSIFHRMDRDNYVHIGITGPSKVHV